MPIKVPRAKYARSCCLHCRHGHGPPIGRTEKTRFLSTHERLVSLHFENAVLNIAKRNLETLFFSWSYQLTNNESRRALYSKAVHGIQAFFSLIRHLKSIIFVVKPYLSSQRLLVKRPMTLLTAMNASQQVTKTIFNVDSRNSSHNRKPEFVLKTEVCVS